MIVAFQPVAAEIDTIVLGPAWVTTYNKNDPDFTRPRCAILGSGFDLYDYNLETTTNGDTLVKIDVQGSLVSDLQSRFVLNNQDSENQADTAQRMIESSGLNVNAAQFAEAQIQANNKMCMSFPLVNSETLDTVGAYLQIIAKNNNGLFFIDDQTELVGYKIVNENLTGIDWTVSEVEILEPEISPKVEYQDVVDTITTTNPTYKVFGYLTDFRSASAESLFARSFNQRDVDDNQESFLETQSNALQTQSVNRSNPNTFYSFSVKPDKYFTMQIGEIVRVENIGGRLLGALDTVDLLIVELTKSAETIGITGYEFQRLP